MEFCKFLTAWLMTIAMLAAVPLRYADAQPSEAQNQSIQVEGERTNLAGQQGLDLTPPDSTGIKRFSMRAISAADGTVQQLASTVRKMISGDISFISEVDPDVRSAVPERYYTRSIELARALGVKGYQHLAVSTKNCGDWFKQNKLRVTIIAVEVTLVSGLKFVELMYSPVPISYASAITASLFIGLLTGTMEWNILRVLKFIQKPGVWMKRTIERIQAGARAAEANPESSRFLRSLYRLAQNNELINLPHQLAKNTMINFALIGAFKIIVFATTQTDGSFWHGMAETFQTVSTGEVENWGKLAVEATVVSFPTSRVISAEAGKDFKEAGNDPIKLKNAGIKLNLMMATALTARIALFSSLMVATVLHLPMLSVVAYSGLGVMFVASMGKWVLNARNQGRIERCTALFR